MCPNTTLITGTVSWLTHKSLPTIQLIFLTKTALNVICSATYIKFTQAGREQPGLTFPQRLATVAVPCL